MTDAMLAEAFDRTVSIEEFRSRVSEILFENGIQVTTLLSCHHHWIPDTQNPRRLVNSVNLSFMAKAFALWGSPSGRPLNITQDSESEELWFLRSANSLPWYSRDEVEGDLDRTMIAYLVRQAYLVSVVNDPVDGLIARNFLMFHRLIQQEDVPVKNISAEFFKTFGMTLDAFLGRDVCRVRLLLSFGKARPYKVADLAQLLHRYSSERPFQRLAGYHACDAR